MFSFPAPRLNNKVLSVIWAAILLIVNYPLFFGNTRSQLIFFPDAVLGGQWWQIFTHPFVHLSWYHLLLDGLAFVILYLLLEEKRNVVRLFYSITAGMGALLFALLTEPAIYQRGLCGLSGAAHGLMAISALEMLRHKQQKGLGLLCLGAVVVKSIYELYSGQVFLESLHMGLTGQPVVASHAGGVLGGLLAFVIMKIISGRTISRRKKK
jgi:rhomboid family GlyGly-CTERM serine protease